LSGLKIGFFWSVDLVCFTSLLPLPNLPEEAQKSIKIIKINFFFKCTLVHALRLCTGRTVRRGSRGIALLFHDLGTRRG